MPDSGRAVEVTAVPLPGRAEPEIQVTRVSAPASVRRGQPFYVEVVVTSNRAGSGAIDLSVTACCVKNKMIPPSANVEKVDSECGLNIVQGDPIDAKVNAAVSVAYSLSGGQNAALVLKHWEA